jgi:hypothetical protein
MIKRIVLLLMVLSLMLPMALPSGVAFAAASMRASCLGVQRSNADQGDVGRFARETAGEEFFGHKGQKGFATQGQGPGRTTVESSIEIEGSEQPGKPGEPLAYSVSCATVTER